MRALLALGVAVLLLGACAVPPGVGLTEVLQRPAERALLNGLRAYDDAQYAQAERELQKALAAGLASPKDRAMAHKHLAFVFCTSQRMAACEAAFRAALAADPEFALTRAEAGHPLWGPVYRRVGGGR
ncbi:MAG TPA: TssQ family T6SS-associated lipoprotein [Burkholderiaceae bacterium]|nr:TssQ family T6SS-associated lipoprotein [Burkholderiaceae bacterium]